MGGAACTPLLLAAVLSLLAPPSTACRGGVLVVNTGAGKLCCWRYAATALPATPCIPFADA